MILENYSIKDIFNRLAVNGFLGDPTGEIAYCYVRVSSTQQAEEGRTGLPRQIQHCHEVAEAHHLRIPWEMIFADDGYSGFEFENRPALSRLREEIRKGPRSCYVVIEHLDRLSRNARWHQGFLLDELTRYRITSVFWKAFGSEIERAVLGTIAEQGMRSEISRMTEGARLKAESGRVTAKSPRFGYMFVDSQGQVSDKARQDTHYALDPEKAKIVRWIFDRVLLDHISITRLANEMNEKKMPLMFRGEVWHSGTLNRIVRDPIYKGEFYAHRWFREETGRLNSQGRPIGIMRERPASEWIKVEVPAIVSPSEWEAAQEILNANRRHSTRHMIKREWLLSSFIKCDICRYSYRATTGGSLKRQRENNPLRYYGCEGRFGELAKAKGLGCQSPQVRADGLETFVWSKVEQLVTNEELVLRLITEDHQDPVIGEEEQHLEYIKSQLAEAASSYKRWEQAYASKVITLDEFAGYRTQYQAQKAELEQAKHKVERKIGKRISLEEKKRRILASLARLRENLPEDENEEVPFETKRQLLHQLIKCVWVNSEKKTIRFEGVLKSTYEGEDTQFVFGSSR